MARTAAVKSAPQQAAPKVQPIHVECTCGAKYDIAPEHVGEKFRCEAEGCAKVLTVPTPEYAAMLARIRRALDMGRENPAPERERLAACEALVKMGGDPAVTLLVQGLYDPSRNVVNAALRCLLSAGELGPRQILGLMNDGALRMSRLVAMIRELEWWEGADLLCDLIDEGRLNESQISETITLLGEARRRRCISTLTTLRRGFPNLAMLVDNSLATYRHLDSQVNKIPDDAKLAAQGDEVDASRLGTVQKTAKAGCLPALLIGLSVPTVIAIWQVLA